MQSLDDAFSQACARFKGDNFAQLDEVDKVLVTIWGLEADVSNGGFDQYYFNGSGDQAFYGSDALQSIGAYQMASIVSSANKVFGPEGPSGDSSVRQAQLFLVAPNNDMPSPWEQLDRAFYAYPDDIATLLTAYLRAAGRLST
jgi:hypothetical protein